MSDRIDRKLEEVAVARYGYRHEAEFAAGFLTDARIPFRLQVDDPAMGLAVSASATIWVLAMDADRARETLELDGSHAARLSAPAQPTTRRLVRPPGRALEGSNSSGPTLGGRERVLSVLGAVFLAAAGGLLFSDGGPIAIQAALGAVVVFLILVGLVGRAPGLLRGLLSALAGTAP
jgi:hypothetical protein